MISQTETASNHYGFYAVPKKLQPKKKYREEEYQEIDDLNIEQQNQFQPIQKPSIPENQVERDFYVDEPPYPEFKPKQRGLDYGVQIQKGDLFDFDLEVQPLLQIIVGRSVVSAINELQEQKERMQKKQKLETYQKKRNAELMVTQRLEAKSKRKKEQSERRVLQKQIFVKDQKQLGRKVITRQTAKRGLLGLGSEVISQLEQAGFLRSQAYTDLRINYEGWLYEQITSLIQQEDQIKKTVVKMINEVEEQQENQHKKRIQKEKKRRQDILDERDRVRKLVQERKEKKRIKKQRIDLNKKREPYAIRFEELLQKYAEIEHILKQQNLSSGISSDNSPTVYVSGGVMNFLITILNSIQQTHFTADEMEQTLIKLFGEMTSPLEVEFQESHYNLIQQEIDKMNQNPNQFMINKVENVANLKKNVGLDLKLLENLKVNLKSSLHDSIVEALLNIILTTTSIPKPEQEDQNPIYSPTNQDKIREEIKKKIQLSLSNHSLSNVSTILRVRFERKQPSESEKKSSNEQKSSGQQWIDIYDGQGWNHHIKQFPEETNRVGQKPAALTINGFENSFIYDERTLFYLKNEIQKLFGIESGPDVKKYIEGMANIASAFGKDIPVYDGELRVSE